MLCYLPLEQLCALKFFSAILDGEIPDVDTETGSLIIFVTVVVCFVTLANLFKKPAGTPLVLMVFYRRFGIATADEFSHELYLIHKISREV